MRRARVIAKLLLVLSLILSTQSLLVVQVAFEVRQDVIAEHLCVNRDRPEMNCDGYCHLAKQHNEAREQREQEQAAHLETLLALHLLIPARTFAVPPAARPHIYSQPPRSAPSQGQPRGVFRPPRSA